MRLKIKLIASNETKLSINKSYEIGRNLLCRTLILTPYLGITNRPSLDRNFIAPETDVNI